MRQDETIIFRASKDIRIIDRIITLTAQDKKVVFGDSKEGALGIRVTRQIEEPSTPFDILRVSFSDVRVIRDGLP